MFVRVIAGAAAALLGALAVAAPVSAQERATTASWAATTGPMGVTVRVTATITGKGAVTIKVRDCYSCDVRVVKVRQSAVREFTVQPGGAWMVSVKGAPQPAGWEVAAGIVGSAVAVM